MLLLCCSIVVQCFVTMQVKQAELGVPLSKFKFSQIVDPKKLLGRENFWVQIIFWIKKRFCVLKCFGLKVCMKKVLDFRKLRFESFCYNTVLGLNNILGNPLDIFQTPATRLSDTFWTPSKSLPDTFHTSLRNIRPRARVIRLGGRGSLHNTASLRLHLAS